MADTSFYTLREAVLQGFDAAAQYLAQDPAAIHARNNTGETVFHWFVVENELELVSWLRAQGAEVDNKTNFGDTPLLEAASLGYLDMCRYLLSVGADPCVKNALGYTAIGSAALENQTEVLRLLVGWLPQGSDINDQLDSVTGSILLDIDSECGQLLIQMGLRFPGSV